LPQTGELFADDAGVSVFTGVFAVFDVGVVLQATPVNVTLQPYVQFVSIPQRPFTQSCFVFPSRQRETVHCTVGVATRAGVGIFAGVGVCVGVGLGLHVLTEFNTLGVHPYWHPPQVLDAE
jgi:hypothetical protein